MHTHGLTRAGSMGPVAELVRRNGGAPDPLFRRHGLSLRLVEEPERLILLRDQLALVESAARQLGDPAFGARLSTEVGFAGLGEFGRYIGSATTLGAAIERTCRTMTVALQSATAMQLQVRHGVARWSYAVTEQVAAGRGQNELLAMGYELDLCRHYAGRRWQPTRIEVPGLHRSTRAAAESVFGAEVGPGEVAGIVFPARLLRLPVRLPPSSAVAPSALPDLGDLVACAARVVDAALLEGRPGLPLLARRLGTPPRTLQRRLAAEGTSFEALLRDALQRRAGELLAAGHSVTATAVELGYSDTAHFTRAYRGWTGVPPSAHRAR